MTFEGSRFGNAFSLSSRDVAGASVDAAGRRTYLVRRRNAFGAVLGTVVNGDIARDELYTVTTGRGGRPLDLGVLRAGNLSGSVSLPKAVQPAVGLLHLPGTAAPPRHVAGRPRSTSI